VRQQPQHGDTALAHLGVRHIDIPITPEKVWNILREKGVAE
jgi:carbon-monoxide dehydrogenase large subunit